MQQPNPWILLMGGIALLNVSMMVSAIHAAAWIRYGGMAICIALGLTSMGLGIQKYFGKKPERPRFVSKRGRASQASPPRPPGGERGSG
jgi:ABC-type uncharacterized transport system permease subunit